MSELRQAVDAVKTQGKFHRAFLLVVDALDKFENFDASYHSAENHAAAARDRLTAVKKDLEVAEVDKGVLTAEVEALHIEKARAKGEANREGQEIVNRSRTEARQIVEAATALAQEAEEADMARKHAAKDAHDVAMLSYNQQQNEARQHLTTLKEELARLKAKFDA